MTSYIPDPEFDGCHISDETPIPRHEFTAANQLEAFAFGENDNAGLRCPDDCGAFCEPANLGEAVDWALGHKCEPEWAAPATPAPMAREKETDR
jgi:hypothetical protein